jgi:hypothetical protein
MSPQINKSDFGLYRYFKVASNPFRNWLKSPSGDLYRPSITKLDVLVSICTAQHSTVQYTTRPGDPPYSVDATRKLIFPS